MAQGPGHERVLRSAPAAFGIGWSQSLAVAVALVLIAVTVVGFLTWVIGSDARTRRLARLLRSRRGEGR